VWSSAKKKKSVLLRGERKGNGGRKIGNRWIANGQKKWAKKGKKGASFPALPKRKKRDN